MGRRASIFSQSDVERAVKATRNAGLQVGAVEISKSGTIRVVVGSDVIPTKPDSPFDEWKGKQNAC